MSIKLRLIIMNFLQFFVWGSWLTSLGVYLGKELHFEGSQIATVFATMGVAALVMPALLGIVADKWINSERVLGGCHILGAFVLLLLTGADNYGSFIGLMLVYTALFMPTMGLINSTAYCCLQNEGLDVIKDFPPIRVWGTVGFIVAMWAVDLLGWTSSINQLYLAAGSSLLLGLYCFTLPQCPPVKKEANTSLISRIGLDAFVLFKEKKMAIFFVFSMLLGAALQITNTFGQPFLSDFGHIDEYKDSFAVLHPGILTSVSQISESLFILAIPFFMKRYGIKTVMLMSMTAWVLRFGFFGIGDPGSGMVFLVSSMIVYGMAFDFFNVSGSLFIEQQTDSSMRSSAQGLFVLMTNGIGTILGTVGSGFVVDHFTDAITKMKDWPSIWFSFAGYALVLAILFVIVFKEAEHKEKKLHAHDVK